MLPAFAILSGLLTVISVILGMKLAKNQRLLDSVTKESNDLAEEAKKQSARVDEVQRKLTGVRTQLQDKLQKIRAESQKKQSELKKERDQLLQKLNVMEQTGRDSAGSLGQAEDENQTLKARTQELEDRVTKLKSQLDSQIKKYGDKADDARRYESELAKYKDRLDGFVNMELKNEQLKETVGSQRRRLNVLAKAAEHNRVAWIVTQKQLEMAEDRIHMLVKGFARPGERTHDPDVILADMISKRAESGETQA